MAKSKKPAPKKKQAAAKKPLKKPAKKPEKKPVKAAKPPAPKVVKKAAPPAVAGPIRVDLARARAFWHERQGLGEPVDRDPAKVVSKTGWVRTLGGIDVYLAIRARCPSVRREHIDQAVAAGALKVSPAARGCIYLIPSEDAALAMRLAGDLSRPRAARDMQKAGVDPKEVTELASAVADALKKGPLTTDGIRATLPEGAIRSLGERGKKVGLSSPLPVALRELEFDGRIERILASGRLDSEKYEWRLCRSGEKVPATFEARLARLAERFLDFAAPATTRDFAEWIGVPQRDAGAAIAAIPAVPVAVEGYGEECWILEAHRAALAATAPRAHGYKLLPFEDLYMVLHGGPGVLADRVHHGRRMEVWGSGTPTTLGEARHMSNRAILLGSDLVGVWEFQPDSKEVVAATFDGAPLKPALAEACHAMARFIAEDLGHGRSFSLDTEDSLRQRARTIQKA